MAEKHRTKGLVIFGKLYVHPLEKRTSFNLSESTLFLSSHNTLEWLSKEQNVCKSKVNIYYMLVLLCVIVNLLYLVLFLCLHW